MPENWEQWEQWKEQLKQKRRPWTGWYVISAAALSLSAVLYIYGGRRIKQANDKEGQVQELVAEHNEKIKQKDEQLQITEKKLADSEARIVELQTNYKKLEEQYSPREAALKKLEDIIRNKTDLDPEEITGTISCLEREKGELADKIRQLEEEKKKVAGQLTESDKKYQAEVKKIKDLETELKKAEDGKKTLEEEVEKLKAKANLADALRIAKGAVEQMLKDVAKERDQLKKEKEQGMSYKDEEIVGITKYGITLIGLPKGVGYSIDAKENIEYDLGFNKEDVEEVSILFIPQEKGKGFYQQVIRWKGRDEPVLTNISRIRVRGLYDKINEK